jgi:hypothetical protein
LACAGKVTPLVRPAISRSASLGRRAGKARVPDRVSTEASLSFPVVARRCIATLHEDPH